MSGIINPHDKFFRESFSQLDIIKDFLEHYLSADICKLLDLNRITIQKDSFIDNEFHEHFSDLLFLIPLKEGGEMYVYTLLEHKSYPDPLVALQLLRYMVKIWERDVKDAKIYKLRCIIPIVIYHGGSKWQISTHFADLFLKNEIFNMFVPGFEYLIYDIQRYNKNDLIGDNKLRVVLWLLGNIFKRDFLKHLKEDVPLFAVIKQDMISKDFLQTVLLYIFRSADQTHEDEIKKEIKSQLLLQDGDNIMVTIAEKLIQEGWRSGKQEGWQSGKLDAIHKVLQIRFGELPDTIKQKLDKIDDSEKLENLLASAVTANSLPDFMQTLR